MAQLICPECGLVDLAGTNRCPECGMTALDDSDPANRDAIDEAIALGRERMRPRWGIPVMFVAIAVGFILGTWLGNDPRIGEVLMYPLLIGTALLTEAVGRRRLSPR